VVLYDQQHKIPIFSSEYLKLSDVQASAKIGRKDAFHTETRLPKPVESLASDYAKAGYDKGHLTPSNDAPDGNSQFDTFSMANMVPQTPNSNRNMIRLVEAAVQKSLIDHNTNVHVVTGVILGNSPKIIGHGVAVPDITYKALMYDNKSSCVYIMSNDVNPAPTTILSLQSFNDKYGVLPFPGEPESSKVSSFCTTK